MIQEINIPVVRIPKVGLPIVGWESIGENEAPSKPERIYPSYELSCDHSEFIKNNEYTVYVRETQASSERMQVHVVCVGGDVTTSTFWTDSLHSLNVTPTEDTCIITLVCNGREVGRFEMRDVLTVPEYIFRSDAAEYEIGKEYELTIARVTAPVKQTQIEISCVGGVVSPSFLVDEGDPYAFEDANRKILITPTDEKCTITLKVSLAGKTYDVGKYTLNATLPINTIRIDQNISDPDTMITGSVNSKYIQEIRNNSHIYLCKYLGEKDGVGQMAICQLDDNDSNYYYDGTPADLTGLEGDVFMKLPKLYTLAKEIKKDIWNITFAYGQKPDDGDDWTEFSGNDLIGVYKAYSKNSKLYSISGFTPITTVSYINFKTFVKNRGTGYSLVKRRENNIMAFLFFASYGTTNFVSKFGIHNDNHFIKTGSTNEFGMSDVFASDTSDRIKFWGLENWFNDVNEIEADSLAYQKVITITDEFGIRSLDILPNDGYIKKIIIGKYLDTIPIELGATSNTGFCSYFFTIPITNTNTIKYAIAKAGYNIIRIGPAYLNPGVGETWGGSQYGSRISFTGELIEYTNVEEFKAIPIIN